jgi:hypothetical protein
MTTAEDDPRPNEVPLDGTQPRATGGSRGVGGSRATGGPHGVGEPHDAAEPHGSGDHAMDPGHEHDDHAHMDVPLGPVDWAQWAAGAGGVALGLITWFCFAFATS